MAGIEEAIYAEVPGGPELMRWFGGGPSFHDGEIVSLHLTREGTSRLTVPGWIMTDHTASGRQNRQFYIAPPTPPARLPE